MLCFYTAPETDLLFISKAFSNICAAHILSHFSSILRCRYWYSRNVFTICNFMTNNFTAKYAYYIQRFYKLYNEKRKSEIATCLIHFKQKNTKRTFCISVLNLPKHNKKYHKIVFRINKIYTNCNFTCCIILCYLLIHRFIFHLS